MAGRGHVIAIEGIDNVGKTSTAKALRNALAKLGRTTLVGPEFAEDALGKAVRRLVETQWATVHPEAQPLLIAAERIARYRASVEDVKQGNIVVFDRHLLSAAIYQAIAARVPTGTMWRTLQRLYGDLCVMPSLTLVLQARLTTVVRRGGDDIHSRTFLKDALGRYRAACNGSTVIGIDAEQAPNLVVEACLREVRTRVLQERRLDDSITGSGNPRTRRPGTRGAPPPRLGRRRSGRTGPHR
jgi:thymidylate kinase